MPDDAHRLLAEGMARLGEGKAEEATALLERAVRANPGSPAAWSHLGMAARDRRQHRAALACFRRAMVLSPARLDSPRGMASIHGGAARSRWLRTRFLLSPLDRWTNFEIAGDLRKSGDPARAAHRLRWLLVAYPADPVPLFTLGRTLGEAGAPAGAAKPYRWSTCAAARQALALNGKGVSAARRSDWFAAEKSFAAAARAAPGLAPAWLGRARALRRLGRDAESAAQYRRVLAIDPADPAAGCELAELAGDSRRALRALAADPSSPRPHLCLGRLAASRPEALRRFRRAAVAGPDDAEAWYALAAAADRDGDPEAAVRFGVRATCIRDDHAAARRVTAGALLALGRFRAGWAAHARRLDSPDLAPFRRRFAVPEWTDGPIRGRHLLLWGETRVEDETRMLTLVPHLLRQGARLTLLVEQRLRPLVRRGFPGAAVPAAPYPDGTVEDHRGADLQLALGDLPGRLDLFCGGEAAPEPWIRPDPDRVAALRAGLQARHPGRRLVGIVTGSIPLDLWREALSGPGIAAVSLQHDPGDAVPMDAEHGVEPLVDFDGLAALVAAVDLVVCPAGDTAELAGAMAKPCWTLVPAGSDRRWGGETAPWYPGRRVYRQGDGDDWRPAMARIAADLSA